MSASDFQVKDLRTGENLYSDRGEVIDRVRKDGKSMFQQAAEMALGRPVRPCPSERAWYKVSVYWGAAAVAWYEPDE